MNYKFSLKGKKAMELPINVLVMMIIGIMLFGIGMTLFFKISNSSEDEVDRLNDKIRNNIASLECQGEDWICAPTIKLKKGETQTYEIFASNRGDSTAEFKIILKDSSGTTIPAGGTISSVDCGTVKINYLSTLSQEIKSGNSATFPVLISANKVKKPCSFTAVVELIHSSSSAVKGKTPLIILVE